jgi:hypothetical protein
MKCETAVPLFLASLAVAPATAGPTDPGGVAVEVSGECNPFLAGQPPGTTSKTDVAPDQSPLLVPMTVAGGEVLEFTGVDGTVSYDGEVWFGPEDGFSQYSASDLGISGYTMPLCALLGVFLPDHTNSGPAPAELDFSGAASRDFATLAPELFQSFFIGDGLRADGATAQRFVVPPGATRLFLGVCDGSEWNNNLGSFQCTVDLTTCVCTVAIYCTAKVNSQGCTPAIGYVGTPSLTGSDDFYIEASNVLNYRAGLLIWSRSPDAKPFLGGVLCVSPPIRRTTLQDSAGNPGEEDCSGTYEFHMSQAYMAAYAIGCGDTVYAQYWSRDPLSVPHPAGLTDAIEFSPCL